MLRGEDESLSIMIAMMRSVPCTLKGNMRTRFPHERMEMRMLRGREIESLSTTRGLMRFAPFTLKAKIRMRLPHGGMYAAWEECMINEHHPQI